MVLAPAGPEAAFPPVDDRVPETPIVPFAALFPDGNAVDGED
jgi:hypothetical protein